MKHLLKDKTAPIGVDYAIVSYDSVNDKVIVTGGSEPTPPQPTYEYVDLGLPSGLKWATCNVGATKPEEYGLYFQWGDIEGRTADEIETKPCSWDTCPWGEATPPMSTLDSEHDAATVNMGGNWRMPTTADTIELVNNTTSQWYDRGNEEFNGVAGRKFTSKKDSSKYIFIPAAGYANNSLMGDVGLYAYVLSSSLYTSFPYCAYYLNFGSSGPVYSTANGRDRCNGFSVRGVRN